MSPQRLLLAWLAALSFCAPAAHAQIQATAVQGEPFGVATITFPRSGGDRSFYRVECAGGRAVYPVFAASAARRVLTELIGLGGGGGGNVELSFLFTGSAPLELTVYTPNARKIIIPTQSSSRQHRRLMQTWWRAYHAEARGQKRDSDYPPVLQDYLISMLGRRLGLSAPLFSRLGEESPSETQETLELLLGVERLRSAMTASTMRGERTNGEATLPVPQEIAWPQVEYPAIEADIDLEPLARRTPRECLYLRFGTFDNYLWVDHLMEKHGGDLSRMAMLRGQRNALTPRIQQQLVLKKTALSELLGSQVIKDMAVIGRDLFMQEGASIGVLFEAKSSTLLASNLAGLRSEALGLHKDLGATNEKIKIAGKEVSLLSTPDNTLRSYYVADGRFHLVTSSRSIAERFIRAPTEKTTLADTDEFRFARLQMPTSRNDTVFVYVSRHFLQGLVSPTYQIELNRRLESTVDMQLLELARAAAANERSSARTVDDLIRLGFLPNGFGRRPDGSGLVATETESFDSLRGRRGSFLPVADVELKTVTQVEAETYARKAQSYLTNWKQFDPIMIGVMRSPASNGIERIVIDGRIAPIDESKYGWFLSVLGPPNNRRVSPAPGDIVNVQASVQGGLLSTAIPPHELFLGIQDNAADIPQGADGLLKTLQIITATPGYLGSWPKAGYLDWLPLDWSGAVPDVFGFSRLPLGIWRRQWAGFSAMSFHRDVLENATPGIEIVEDPTPAQIRVHVGDVSTAQIRGWIDRLYFDRARMTTIGNLRLMHFAEQQFGILPRDSKSWVENILDSELVCTLDGQYQLAKNALGERWTTTALNDAGDTVKPFESPIMSWFRGLKSHLLKDGDGLIVRAELDMAATGAGVPGLSPFLRALGGSAKPEEKKKPKSDAKDF